MIRCFTLLALLTMLALPTTAQEIAPPPQAEPVPGDPAAVAETNPAVATEHAPKIVCEQPTFNFGEVDNSQDVAHTFIVRNDGDLSLEIARVRPSCGCTVANISHNTIPPGSIAEITTKLSLHGRQGPQKKAITVESNDPKQPQLMLWLEGSAIAELQLQPNQVFFGRITGDAVVTGIVQMVTQSTNAVNITRLVPGSPQLTATNEVTESGRVNVIRIITRPPLSRGTLRGDVRIETDHPKYPSMNVIVSAFVVSELTYVPEEIVLTEAPGQPVTRYVLIRSEGGKPFEIKSAEGPDPSIKVNIQKTGETAYRLELNDIKVSPELNGKMLKVTTTVPGMEEISIPFRAAAPTPMVPPSAVPQ